MAVGRSRAQGRPSRSRTAVSVPWAGRRARVVPDLGRFAPSRRSVAVGFGLLAVAAGVYLVARHSSAFAIDRVDVSGAPAGIDGQVRRAVAPLSGTSLLALNGAALERGVEALPTVVSVGYDRAFPHTLRLTVVPETPAAVVRRGKESWLVSARGRVIARVPKGSNNALARIWVKRAATVVAGGFLAADAGGAAARALAVAARFPARIATATLVHGELVFRLRSGLLIQLGEPTDVRLKLAIARRALRQLPAGSAYVDVSVSGRPVAGPDPQVSGGG